MRVFAVNSSPRTGKASKTEILLDCLVEGARAAGATVDVVNLREKRINNCVGCFTCWTKTPGSCVMHDDMAKELLPRYMDCDLCVLATPLYHYTLNAQMKAFIERTLPIVDPMFVERDGVTSHDTRQPPPATVVVSLAAFPEPSVFDQLRSYVRFLFGESLVAEIYRPSSEVLRKVTTNSSIVDVLAAAREAGSELVESKCLSSRTKDRIEQPLVDFQGMAPLANLAWRNCIAQGVTPAEFRKKRLRLRPDSIDSFLTVMELGFKTKKAGGVTASFQFLFSGETCGECFVSIRDGNLECGEGKAERPDIVVEAPFDLWMDILVRKADGENMLKDGKYVVHGDLSYLPLLRELFR